MGTSLGSKNSFMDSLRNFNFSKISNAITLMKIDWFQVGTFFVSGIVAGFLFRKYFRDLVTWFFITAVIVIVLDYVGVVTIKWETVQGVVGVSPLQTLDSVLQAGFAWAKGNVPLVISFVIGFTVGIKVG